VIPKLTQGLVARRSRILLIKLRIYFVVERLGVCFRKLEVCKLANAIRGISAALPRGTVSALMEVTHGRTSGFEYLRIMLACCVILSHSRVVTFGEDYVAPFLGSGPDKPHPPVLQPILWAIVPSFFALSGFLVAGSLMRSKTIVEFALLRVLRIVPALFVETVIAAFILGPLVTELPLRSYFTGEEFWSYPLNIVGDIHYRLPGVFVHNPLLGIVNIQLWTIPSELMCYVSLVAAYISLRAITRFKTVELKTWIGVLAALSLVALVVMPGGPARWDAGGTRVADATLVLSFLIGVTMFLYRERIPLNFWLFGTSALLSYALLYNGAYQYLASIPITYATVYVGLTNFRRTVITATGDYSYGIYLYGFPIQQTIAFLFPDNSFFLLNFVGALLVAMIFAAMSWRFVESQVLARRKQVIRTVHLRLDRLSALVMRRPGMPAPSAVPPPSE
jgi:peptidoglycan/LPS O-acetylase OafA/YrhL